MTKLFKKKAALATICLLAFIVVSCACLLKNYQKKQAQEGNIDGKGRIDYMFHCDYWNIPEYRLAPYYLYDPFSDTGVEWFHLDDWFFGKYPEHRDTLKKLILYHMAEIYDAKMARAYLSPEDKVKMTVPYKYDEEEEHFIGKYIPDEIEVTRLEEINYMYGLPCYFDITLEDLRFVIQLGMTFRDYSVHDGYDWDSDTFEDDYSKIIYYALYDDNDPTWKKIPYEVRRPVYGSDYDYYKEVYSQDYSYTPDWNKYTLTKKELTAFFTDLIEWIPPAANGWYPYTEEDKNEITLEEMYRGVNLDLFGISYIYWDFYNFDGLTGERAASDWFKVNFLGCYDDIFVKHKYPLNASYKDAVSQKQRLLWCYWYEVRADGTIKIDKSEAHSAHGCYAQIYDFSLFHTRETLEYYQKYGDPYQYIRNKGVHRTDMASGPISPTPTEKPTATPTPTTAPTPTPTSVPTATTTPTPEPTPTKVITPTAEPTEVPTPTEAATETPTPEPTAEPTIEPTEEPIEAPTAIEILSPTEVPVATEEPTAKPELSPTTAPTKAPTVAPPADKMDTTEPVETPKKNGYVIPIVIVVLLIAAGCGAFIVIRKKNK